MMRSALAAVRHHAALYAGVAAAAALCAALVGGGLQVGDALRDALAARTDRRLGPADFVVLGPEGGVTPELGPELARELGVPVASTLFLPAVARAPDGLARGVDLWGVDASLAALAARADVVPVPGEVRMRADLLQRLGVAPGERLVLRVERPGALPRDVALAQSEGAVVGLSVQVGEALPEAWPARGGLGATPGDPDVVLVDRAWLAERLNTADRPNRLWVGGVEMETVRAALAEVVTLEDGGLRLLPTGNELQLTTPRMLLRETVAAAASALPGAVPGLVWLADAFEGPSGAGAYAFVGALDPGPAAALAQASTVFLPTGDGIVLVDWLAHDLGAQAGDPITLRYPQVERGRGIVYDQRTFTVQAVVPDSTADASWMPPLEGVEGRASCRDWDPGLPLSLDRITDRDEAWWSAHGGAPKAWVPWEVAQEAFASPLGDTTVVRFPAGTDPEQVRASLGAALGPSGLGVTLLEVRAQLTASEAPANDFGVLFLGFQCVLIGAALGLAALQSSLVWELRRHELGTLRALGWSRGRVLGAVARELAVVCVAGAVLGAPLSLAVSWGLGLGLAGPWRTAVPGLEVTSSLHLAPLLVGSGVATILVGLAGLVTAWRAVRRDPRALLAGSTPPPAPGRPLRWAMGAAVSLTLGLAVVLTVPGGRTPEAALAFFGAGALALLAGVLGVGAWLLHTRGPVLGAASARRRPGRALAVVSLLGAGTFLVAGVGLGGGRAPPDAASRSSGAGGFGWIVQSTLPVPDRLDRAAGLVVHALDRAVEPSQIVPLKQVDGDDASCLQLGSAQSPTLLGVDPEAFSTRQAFAFVDAPDGADPWSLLSQDLGAGVVPAIADASTVTWGLHLARGGRLDWVDREGHTVKIEIVAVLTSSIFQGSLLLDREVLDRHFPSGGGDRLWLVDGPADAGREAAEALTTALADRGATALPTAERLAAFAAVEDAYIGVFRALGGLGLVLASLGLALVLARAVVERRGELALLRALGFAPSQLAGWLVVEHSTLVVSGLAVGLGAAIVAAWPALQAPDAAPPWLVIGAALAAAALVGIGGLAVAASWALRAVPLRELTSSRR